MQLLKYKIIVLLTVVGFAAQAQSPRDYGVKISLDSAYLLMGKKTPLHIEITEPLQDAESTLMISGDTLSRYIEISEYLPADTVSIDKNNNRRIIQRDIILQSFDSGLYAVGPVKLLTPAGETVLSNPLSLKVIPANVDSLETIHSIAPVVNAKSRWWDFLPDFILDYWLYCILVIIIVAGAIVAWLIFRKKVAIPFINKPKPVSPYVMAIESLDNLRDKHLCERGMEKEFYTELTDILRRYLETRFNINAMEMTSTQILASLKNNDEINRHHSLIKRILDIADFVKFAKVRPLPADNVASWTSAREFVVDTKPVETNPDDQDGNVANTLKGESKENTKQ